MNKTLIAIAAAAFALALPPAAQAGFAVPSLNAKSLVLNAGCDGEDRAEYLEERAEARAEAIEDGEGYALRQPSAQSRAEVQRTSAEPQHAPAKSLTSTADAGDKKDDNKDTEIETKKADASEPKKSDSKSVASVDGGSGSCKKYFSSVGMTLSVPCE